MNASVWLKQLSVALALFSQLAAALTTSLPAAAAPAASANIKTPGKPAGPAVATTASDVDQVAATFEAASHVHPDAVRLSPIEGIYEIDVGARVFYVDKKVEHYIDGNVFTMSDRTNLTAARVAEINAAINAKTPKVALDLSHAIKRVKGNGSRVLITFEDPRCGFCKRLNAEVAKLDDITIYTFPVAILGPASVEKAKAAWCSENRGKSWSTLMAGGDIPDAPANCDTTALDANEQARQNLHVENTPTVIFPSGERVDGTLTAQAIEAKFATH
jgi:thiol:disulfide interchange protein DsbC